MIRNTLAVCLLLMPTVLPMACCWLPPFLCIAPNCGLLLLTVTQPTDSTISTTRSRFGSRSSSPRRVTSAGGRVDIGKTQT